MTKPVSGIGAQYVDLAAVGGGKKLVDALDRRQVGFDRLDGRAELLEVRGGGLDQRLVGDDENVVAVLCRKRGEFEADAGRRAGDDREFAGCCCGSHGSISSYLKPGFRTILVTSFWSSWNIL